MNIVSRGRDEITRDIYQRLDPAGETQSLMSSIEVILGSPGWRRWLKDSGVDLSELDGLPGRANQLIQDISDSIVLFAPRGWVPTKAAPASVYGEATGIFRETGSIEAAEVHLTEGWNTEWALLAPLQRLANLGKPFVPMQQNFRKRYNIVREALKLHQAGTYAASVPMLFPQIDGIVGDALARPGVSLFHKAKMTDLLDESTIAGLPEGLKTMLQTCIRGVSNTQQKGTLSRHGILHGRELGYDTYRNSTKLFVFLLAVVEWAEPRVEEIAERKQVQYEEANAGSSEIDEKGRLVDRREFDETIAALRWLHTCHIGWWRRQERYQSGLLDRISSGSASSKIVPGFGIQEVVAVDGRSWYAWRQTVTGRVFAIGANTEPPSEWLTA